jgi:outer membrane protein, multidrug efflux system
MNPKAGKRQWTAFGIAACVLGCTSCEVGPNYRAPNISTPASFGARTGPTSPGADVAHVPSSQITATQAPWSDWWTRLGDPELDSLIARAESANHEIKIAVARVQEARSTVRIAESQLYPTLVFNGGAFKTLGSAAGFGSPYGLPGVRSDLFQFGFDASYEIDIFGGIRRQIEGSKDAADAALDEQRRVHITVQAEVARAYITVRSLQQRIAITRANAADEAHTHKIVQRRLKNGLATSFDVVRAQAQVSATEASLPTLDTALEGNMHALAILLGQPPLALSAELAEAKPVPAVPPVLPIGLPSELLRRRPDVMEAERMLAAATAAQGVAVSDLFPHLLLGGSAGVQTRHTNEIFNVHGPSSGFYLAGPSAEWQIFDGGRRKAGIERSKAQVKEALETYEATVLSAIGDVEDASTAYGNDQASRQKLVELVEEDNEAVRIAHSEYSQGLVTLLDVLDVQRNAYAAQDALAQADQAVVLDLVALYKALGGGWEAPGSGDATSKPQATSAAAVSNETIKTGP